MRAPSTGAIGAVTPISTELDEGGRRMPPGLDVGVPRLPSSGQVTIIKYHLPVIYYRSPYRPL